MWKVEVTESDKHSSLLQCWSVRSLPLERSPIGGTTHVGLHDFPQMVKMVVTESENTLAYYSVEVLGAYP